MNQWILILSYLVTPSPSDEVGCAPLPENFKTEGAGCISMAGTSTAGRLRRRIAWTSPYDSLTTRKRYRLR
jgi:hypothetical protein